MDSSLAEQLALLNQNDKLLDDLYHDYATSLHLSDTALWILYIVWIRGEGCTQKDICAMWSYAKQTINSSLKKLEKEGCITLLPLPGNRKSKRVILTEAGKAIAQKAVPPLLEAEAVSLARLDEQERSALVRLSQKRTAFFQKEIEKAIAAAHRE